jgi:CHAD domain-containing protein
VKAPTVASATLPLAAACEDTLRSAAATVCTTEALLADDALDPESIHAARVAVRRLRAYLDAFGPLLETRGAHKIDACARIIARALGTARDADVLIADARRRIRSCGDETTFAPETQILLATLENEREQAYATLRERRSTSVYRNAVSSLTQFARTPQCADLSARRADAGALLERSWRHVRHALQRRSHPPSDADLHRIRIACKRARYTAEALVPLLGQPAGQLAACLADVQGILGTHHDAVTACARYRRLGDCEPCTALATRLSADANNDAKRARHRWRGAMRTAKHAHRRLHLHHS